MKIIKRVRYQRVRYDDLASSDMLTTERLLSEGRRMPKKWTSEKEWSEHSPVVIALDLDKYPPEVTWDVVGLPYEPEIIEVAGPEGIEQINVYKGGIETIYE